MKKIAQGVGTYWITLGMPRCLQPFDATVNGLLRPLGMDAIKLITECVQLYTIAKTDLQVPVPFPYLSTRCFNLSHE